MNALFRSCQQNDDRPSKEEDYKRDKLSDQFLIHNISFAEKNGFGLPFFRNWCIENMRVRSPLLWKIQEIISRRINDIDDGGI